METKKKYEMLMDDTINIDERTLYRIRALKDIDRFNIHKGDLGGYIETEANLSHFGDAWVYWDARVYGNAEVYGDAEVFGNARVHGNTEVSGDAKVCGDAWVYENARVCGDAWVFGDAWVCGNARISGNAGVYGNTEVYGNASVCVNARVCVNAEIYKTTHVVCIGPIGSRNDYTTFYRNKKGGILVVCGCFNGTIEEFEKAVNDTHHNNPKHLSVYSTAIQLAKSQFELD